MPVVYNGEGVEAQLRFTFNDENMENTLYFQFGGTGGQSLSSLEALANCLLIWWEENLKPIQHISCQLREIYLRVTNPDPALTFTLSGDATTFGTVTGDALPGNVSLVVSFRTGLSGRSYRGRNYSLGMVESQQTAGQVTTAYYDALLAAYQDLPTRLADTTDYSHVVYSQYTGGSARPLAVLTSVTAYVIVDSNTDSQRRRNRGIGS